MPEKIWGYLLESVRVSPDVENLNTAEGNLSPEEVRAIALQVLDEQEWHLLEPRKFELIRDVKTGRRCRQITYFLKNIEEEYFTGTLAIVVVDDETGKVINKAYTPH